MKMLPSRILAKLKEDGLVHVTGLQLHNPTTLKITAYEPSLGRYGLSNTKVVLVTECGQVWMGACFPDQDLVENLCPKGGGAFVPCSHGEVLDMDDLLRRFLYPYWGLDVWSADEPDEESFEDVVSEVTFSSPLQEVAIGLPAQIVATETARLEKLQTAEDLGADEDFRP